MTGIATAEENAGTFSAKVGTNGSSFRIFLVDSNDGEPLCPSCEVAPNGGS